MKIAMLGGGNMGRALIGGLLRQGMRAEDIFVGEALDAARLTLKKDFGVVATAANLDAVADANVVVVAVKPQDVEAALRPLADVLQKNRAVVLSVAAGVRTAALAEWCGGGISVVRAMPNRPALVWAGVTALFADARVGEESRRRAENIMRAAGDVVWVEHEEALDVVTALSGSGPAYFFLLAESMMRAAIELGLKEETARQLAIGTLHGSGLLAYSSDGDLARLRAEVTSKGGTTEAAVRVLEAEGFRKTVARAIEAATARSRELGK